MCSSSEDVSRIIYDKLYDLVKEKALRVKLFLKDHKVWIVSLPTSGIHETVAFAFSDACAAANLSLTGCRYGPILRSGALSLDSENFSYNPDASFSYRGPNNDITVVLEIAMSQTLCDVDRKVQNILENFLYINLVMVVTATSGIVSHREGGIIFLVYQRGSTVTETRLSSV